MRRVPTPVTVVTIGGTEPRGITIGSFVTVSLEPPLVSFNVQHSARIHDSLLAAERFAVHVLSSDQGSHSELFADPELSGAEQLSQVMHRLDASGVPVLDGVLSRFLCSVEGTQTAGDHTIVVGRVLELEARDSGDALLYLNRAYRSLGD
ncbi:MAG: flavin reductase family protein [Rhodothermales bacterium]|nr:flavin reductase family protein [Rhodothermales bacterium]